jgi:hypothetical protein
MLSISSRQYFVRIGLVAHIPNQTVFGRVEHIVKRDGQFHGAQVGAEMPTRLRHRLDQTFAQFVGQSMADCRATAFLKREGD